jgi:hypothetical protein
VAYDVFTANTFSGVFQIAIKTTRDHLPGDSRTDAISVAISMWGRGGMHILPEKATVRRISKKFSEVSAAKGWGFIARQAAEKRRITKS